MAIAAKPKAKPVDVHKLIGKGGSVGPSNGNSGPEVPVKLRVPETLLELVDEAVAVRQRQTGIRTGLRHAWILEAITEKLKREA